MMARRHRIRLLALTGLVALGWLAALVGVARGPARTGGHSPRAALDSEAQPEAQRQPGPESEQARDHARPEAAANMDEARSRELRAALASTVSALALEMRSATESLKSVRDAYDECVRAGGDCASAYDDLLYVGLEASDAAARVRRDDFGFRQWTASKDPALAGAARAALGEIAVNSADPQERIAALLLVKYADPDQPVHPRPLPDAAYLGLRAHTGPEARLIADLHRRTPLPSDEAAREFVALAQKSDLRLRRSAYDALGHGPSATRLHEAMVAVEHGPDDWPRLTQAVANCGLPCANSIEYIMRNGGREARVELYEALDLAPEQEIRRLVDVALNSSPPIDAEETAMRATMLEDALASAR
jgi:hypothetical protein